MLPFNANFTVSTYILQINCHNASKMMEILSYTLGGSPDCSLKKMNAIKDKALRKD